MNHALQSAVQNFTSYHMFIEFSKDLSHMNIINRKPLRTLEEESNFETLTKAQLEKLDKKVRIKYENGLLDMSPHFENS